MNNNSTILELSEQMFTSYVDSEFKDSNEDNLAFIGYALWNDCYTTEQLENVLIKNFGDFIIKYQLDIKFTKDEIDLLKELYADTELEKCSNGAKYGWIFEIGNDTELEDYLEDYLEDCFGAKDFLDQFWGYIDWKNLNEDLADSLKIQEFDGLYYNSDIF